MLHTIISIQASNIRARVRTIKIQIFVYILLLDRCKRDKNKQ